MAGGNTYRFSSKMIHDTTGLYYYGFRWYDPNLQRWPNRDPLGERGGLNLYRFARNAPVMSIDPFGLADGEPGTRFPETPPGQGRTMTICVKWGEPTWKDAGYSSPEACFADCMKFANGYGAIPACFEVIAGALRKSSLGGAYLLGTVPGCFIGCNMKPCVEWKTIQLPPVNPADPGTW